MTADSISNCTQAVDMHPLGLRLHQLKKSLKQHLIPMCSSPSLCGPYPTSIQKRRDNVENLKKTAPVILVETSYLTETNYGKSHVEPGQQIRGDGNFQQQSREEAVALFQLAQLQLEQGYIHSLAQTPAAREEMREPEEMPYGHVNVHAA